jgi:hypothetical protein
MQRWIGLGVAGNVAGHLEQAGEAADFRALAISDPNAPKGIFPFYAPGAGEHILALDPTSSDTLLHPGDGLDIQSEPEIGLWCDVDYRARRVARLRPTHFGAHNDCSIRRPGTRKISEKKHWGRCSKGVAPHPLPIDRFEPGGVMDHFRLASFLYRDAQLHAYGVDSPLTGYTYFHGRLLDWLVAQMNHQVDEGPLESIASWLATAGHPERALISIGATRYTDYGESHFLVPGDRAIVVTYDDRRWDAGTIADAVRALAAEDGGAASEAARLPDASLLLQTVRPPASEAAARER